MYHNKLRTGEVTVHRFQVFLDSRSVNKGDVLCEFPVGGPEQPCFVGANLVL